MKYFLLMLLPLLLCANSFHTEEESKLNSSAVVKVFSYSVSPNYSKPWNPGSSKSGTGSGVIIDGNMILTAAHVVSDVTYIEVQKHEDPKKFFAHVKWMAHDADLALLEVEDDTFFKGTVAKKLGTTPKRQEGVAVYGYPQGGNKISITQGIISRIEFTQYVHSYVELLTIQIDAAINPGNSGGPAFNSKGEIVGIAIQSLADSNNIGYIAPVNVIQHLFDDIQDGKYDGMPNDG
ncbi:S1C family serine protease, partial [Campylobacterota bacterium]